MMDLSRYIPQIDEIVQNALDEDLKDSDITSMPLVPPHLSGEATFLAKANGILAGMEIASIVFQKVDPFLQFTKMVNDSAKIKPGDILGTVEGSIRSILMAERTALNFLQHLSGIATLTSHYVNIVKNLPVKILDTRKTVPGLRILEKYAVSAGGGTNHRLNLGDMVLIKDNHIAILRKQGLNIKDIIMLARKQCPDTVKIEIETSNTMEALEAAEAGADIIMLDNMDFKDMRQAVNLINHRSTVEASGGVNLDSVKSIAGTGVDWISVGAITHSAPALDISLKLIF